MEVKANEPVKKKSSNDVMRKKLEAELRATEEIARLKQNVIEKRLAVELASLETEPLDGAKTIEGSKVAPTVIPKPVPKPVPKPIPIPKPLPKPVLKPVPKPAPPPVVPEPRKIRILKKPPIQKPGKEEVEEEESSEDEEEEEEDEESQPSRKGSFLKGVILKWKKKMRPEDRERE